TDDWQGADFIAQHLDGETFLKVQLKGRMTFGKRYIGRDLYVAFPDGSDWFLYPHDDLLAIALAESGLSDTDSWQAHGGYSFPGLSRQRREWLEPYRIAGADFTV
ncbi:MAG: hypothetical protein AAFQ43_12640, partial [Bacteroidota bacterium]